MRRPVLQPVPAIAWFFLAPRVAELSARQLANYALSGAYPAGATQMGAGALLIEKLCAGRREDRLFMCAGERLS